MENAAREQWNGWLDERDTAPATVLAGWLRSKTQEYTQAVFGRAGQVQAARDLLDDGGEPGRQAILAKRAAGNVVAKDADLLERLKYAATAYNEEAAFTTAGMEKKQACLAMSRLLKQAFDELGPPPNAPQASALEEDAIAVAGFRVAKARVLGGDPNDITLWGRGRGGNLLQASSAAQKDSPSPQTIEPLLRELFRLHDLDANGTLEEEELIKLNEKIAMLHYGKDTDKLAVKAKYRDLFRQKFDPNGRSASYESFRDYMAGVLVDLDPDVRGQEMILEQFIAEAESAREAFKFASFASVTDAPYMSKLLASESKPLESRPAGLAPCPEAGPSGMPRAPSSATASSSSVATSGVTLDPDRAARVAFAERVAKEHTFVERVAAGQGEAIGGDDRRPGEGFDARIKRMSAEATARRAVAEAAGKGYGAAVEPTIRSAMYDGGPSSSIDGDVALERFSKNDKIQIWSNGKQAWLDGVVLDAYDAPCFAEGYAVPAGALKVSSAAGKKWIMPDQLEASIRRRA